MADVIQVKVEGIETVQRNLQAVGADLDRYMGMAGQEIGREILGTKGVQQYPPTTAANQPPAPYYIRGRGMQYANGNRGNSERYGTKFTVESKGYTTTIGNSASYAPHLAGEDQARAMARIGWRRLIDVAQEKIEKIRDIYEGWVKKLIKDKGLD